jgi:hypothetical protein
MATAAATQVEQNGREEDKRKTDSEHGSGEGADS